MVLPVLKTKLGNKVVVDFDNRIIRKEDDNQIFFYDSYFQSRTERGDTCWHFKNRKTGKTIVILTKEFFKKVKNNELLNPYYLYPQ